MILEKHHKRWMQHIVAKLGVIEQRRQSRSGAKRLIGAAALNLLLGCAFALVLLAEPAAAARQKTSFVIDMGNNQVLHAANADAQIHPASLTKMMTLYLLFEAISGGEIRLDDMLSVSRRAADQQPSKLGLRPGETISVNNAILAITVKSANDVAVVIAETLADTEPAFATAMTTKSRQLGMRHTNFRNASGLHDANQISTARDMARLGRALFEHFPQYYHYFSVEEFSYGGRSYETHNNLITDYEGSDGIKTGYVRASGFNVVTSATRDGQRLLGVVIGGDTARERDAEMRETLDRAFALAVQRRTQEEPTTNVASLADLPGAARANLLPITSTMRPTPRPDRLRGNEVTRWLAMVAARPVAPVRNRLPAAALTAEIPLVPRLPVEPAIAAVLRSATNAMARQTSSLTARRAGNFLAKLALIPPAAAAADANNPVAPASSSRRPVPALPEPQLAFEPGTKVPLLADNANNPNDALNALFASIDHDTEITLVASQANDGLAFASPGTEIKRDWGIQVGAFGTPNTAARYAADIATSLPVRIATVTRVQHVDVNGQELYRARLFGLSEPEAQQSCTHLKGLGKSCMLVTPAGQYRTATPRHNVN